MTITKHNTFFASLFSAWFSFLVLISFFMVWDFPSIITVASVIVTVHVMIGVRYAALRAQERSSRLQLIVLSALYLCVVFTAVNLLWWSISLCFFFGLSNILYRMALQTTKHSIHYVKKKIFYETPIVPLAFGQIVILLLTDSTLIQTILEVASLLVSLWYAIFFIFIKKLYQM